MFPAVEALLRIALLEKRSIGRIIPLKCNTYNMSNQSNLSMVQRLPKMRCMYSKIRTEIF